MRTTQTLLEMVALVEGAAVIIPLLEVGTRLLQRHPKEIMVAPLQMMEKQAEEVVEPVQ